MTFKMVLLLLIVFFNYIGESNTKSYIVETSDKLYKPSDLYDYQEGSAHLLNPGRGFNIFTETRASDPDRLSSDDLERHREKSGITVVHRNYVLDKFRESAISSDFLHEIEKDLEATDEAGFMMIPRFMYADGNHNGHPDSRDADIDIVKKQLDQLGPILRTWEHVILVLEAGFVGTWGEWYYSDNYNTPSGEPTKEQVIKRRQLLHAILEAVPNTHVMVRTPQILQSALEDEDPVTEDEAFSGSPKSRLGMHNDCFLASDDDFGTFPNGEKDMKWLEAQSKFTFVGGETCKVNHPRSECDEAWHDLQRFHFISLNKDYHPDVLDDWKDDGCFEKIGERMGYRFALDSSASSFLGVVSATGTYIARLAIKNEGISRMMHKRDAKLIFSKGGQDHQFPLDTDLRWIGAGEQVEVEIKAKLAGMGVGEYTVAVLVEGKGSSVWQRVVMDPWMENAKRYNYLPNIVVV